MKTEVSNKVTFKPIRITLETEEEATAMWYRLNTPCNAVYRQQPNK